MKIDVVAQPDLPVDISNMSVHNDPGRQTSELIYTVTARGGGIRSVSLLVTFFNAMNEPLGGEVIRVGQSCGAGDQFEQSMTGSKEFRTALSHYVNDDQRASIAINSFRTETQFWKAEQESIAREMRANK